MFRRKTAAVVLSLMLGATAGACGTDDAGELDNDAGPGQSSEEDPTLGDPEGGGTSDQGEDGTGGQRRGDGGDEGTTPNSVTDSGSGTGAGRGDG